MSYLGCFNAMRHKCGNYMLSLKSFQKFNRKFYNSNFTSNFDHIVQFFQLFFIVPLTEVFKKFFVGTKQKQIHTKHFNTINWFRRQRFSSSNPSGKTICNLSSYNLSETEKFVLAYGLEQRTPTTGPRMEFVRHAEQFCTSFVDHKQP